MDLKFGGRVVLITGCAGGIGVDAARAFLKQGAKVVLHYHRSKESLEPLMKEYPNHTFAVAADATNENQVAGAVAAAAQALGPIHYLVANHAIYEDEEVPIVDMSLDQWKKTIDCNLTGTFIFVREFLKQLRSYVQENLTPEQRAIEHASIVIIGSTAGIFGEALHADYAASKSALHSGFLRSLKNEVIHVLPRMTANVVAPGWVGTRMAWAAIAEGKHLKALKTMPLKKIATTEDVANVIMTTLSPITAGHISGSVIEVAGGMEGRVLWPDL